MAGGDVEGEAGGGKGREGGVPLTFLPSRLCVCQPGHSQFSPRKLGGKNFLSMSILDATTTTQGMYVCVRVLPVGHPDVPWVRCHTVI